MIRLERVRKARDFVAGLPEVRRAAIFGDRLHISVESVERDGPALEDALRAAGFDVLEQHWLVPSMEDVFIDHLTNKRSA